MAGNFLTGSEASIDTLTTAVGFHYRWDEETRQFAHAAGLTIVSPRGTIVEYLDGINFSPRELTAAIERARDGVLTPGDSLTFVRCYLYDPTTGKFGSAVQWTIRVLGLATVVSLMIGVLRLHQRTNSSEAELRNE